MRVLFALPGLHRYARGAEVAFISVARELVKAGKQSRSLGLAKTILRHLIGSCMHSAYGERDLKLFHQFPSYEMNTLTKI